MIMIENINLDDNNIHMCKDSVQLWRNAIRKHMSRVSKHCFYSVYDAWVHL